MTTLVKCAQQHSKAPRPRLAAAAAAAAAAAGCKGAIGL